MLVLIVHIFVYMDIYGILERLLFVCSIRIIVFLDILLRLLIIYGYNIKSTKTKQLW
jgi:hypothetical protein